LIIRFLKIASRDITDLILTTVVKNILDPLNSREIVHLAPGTSYGRAVDILFPEQILDTENVQILEREQIYRRANLDQDVIFSLNGLPIIPEADDIIPDGTHLCACLVPYGGGGGGGKNVFRVVASLALALVSAGIGSAVAGSAWAASWAASINTVQGFGWVTSGMIGAAVGGITYMAGSMILNAVLPVNSAQAQVSSTSATYGWDVTQNPVQSGGPVPEIYGTVRVTPPVIGKYVDQTSDGTSQTLNLLYAVAKWEVDSISGFRINNESLATYGVSDPEIRYGRNNQPIIQAFDDTRLDTPISQKLTTDYTTRTTQGNLVTGIGIGLLMQGLCQFGSSGGTNQASVKVQIQYQKTGDSAWTTLQTTTESEVTTTQDRWSAGYYKISETGDGSDWHELEIGSTNRSDHQPGDPYTPSASVWTTSGDPTVSSDRYTCYWLWIPSAQTTYAAGTVTSDYITISGNTTSQFRRAYYRTQLPEGEYQARVKFYEAPPDDPTNYLNTVYWEFFEELIEYNLTYPNVALAAVRALATSKLSTSSFTTDMLVTRQYVWVWDPDAAAYVQKSASNPAWLSYDLIHKCRKLVDIRDAAYNPSDSTTWVYQYVVLGEPADRIKYYEFSEWAAWCDNTDSGKTQFTCNIYFDTFYTLRKALDMVGLCGRGTVVQIGSEFTCIVEKPVTTPTATFLFTAANIEKDSYSETTISLTDRANVIDITYWDEDDNYTRKTVSVHADDYNTTPDSVKRTSLDFYGCTNKNMAYSMGYYLLLGNKYLLTTASWTAFVDAIGCIPGDIISVPKNLVRRDYSGRVLAGCSQTQILLDRPVTLQDGVTYHIVMKNQATDTIEETSIVSVGGTMSMVEVNALTAAPDADAQWVIGEPYAVNRLMRLITTTRAGDMRRKLTAIEFYNEVVSGIPNTIPTIPATPIPASLIPPALESVELMLVWILDAQTQTWRPKIRINFKQNLFFDNRNLPIPVTIIRIYWHIASGDTHTVAMTGAFDANADWPYKDGTVEFDAPSFVGKTLYVTASMVTKMGVEGPKCAVSAYYVNTAVNPVVPSQVSVDQSKGTYGYDYYDTNYTVYLKWDPSGWALTNNLYAPITTWHGGNNWYEFDHYTVCAGWVAAQGNIPAISDLVFYNTPDIGQIYDSAGNLITDTTKLDTVCRAACTLTCPNMGYSPKWIAWTVVPVTKSGGLCKLDTTLANYGLDWDWILVTSNPSGGGGTLVDITQTLVTNGEMIYTMQGASLFLAEMQWDYPLQSPDIDGFAIIYRAQPYWWMWELKTAITASEISLANIINALDFTTGGGTASATDFCNRYAEWNTGGKIPAFYFLIADSVNSEVIKVDMGTLAVTRGVEGTTAQAFGAGAVLSYAPSEYLDSFCFVQNTHQRSVVLSPTLQVDFALHATIVAWRSISTAPGYIRTPYAYWQYIQR
jgi:hypothetical protein